MISSDIPTDSETFTISFFDGGGGLGEGDGGAMVVDEFRFLKSSQISFPPDGAALGLKQTTTGVASNAHAISSFKHLQTKYCFVSSEIMQLICWSLQDLSQSLYVKKQLIHVIVVKKSAVLMVMVIFQMQTGLIPSASLCFWKQVLFKGLVNTSLQLLSDETYVSSSFFSSTFSLMKKYLTSICFVLLLCCDSFANLKQA